MRGKSEQQDLHAAAICDKYRARVPMGCALMAASIPTACTGLLNSLTGCKCFDNVNI